MTITRRAVGRRVAGWAALTAGLGALVAAAVLGVHSARPPAPAGVLPAAAPAAVRQPAMGSLASTPGVSTTTVEGVPSGLRITALSVDAPVQAVGVDADRALDVPADPHRLGWWIGSAMPGAAHGTVLIVGHVDTARAGAGALFRLETLRLGALIQVRTDDGTFSYRTVARRSYRKQRLPARLFSPDTPAELALVTCGGTFRHGTYSHNVVVYAQPVS